LEGRRARYISPLRLYLMLSLVYFVISAAAPNVKLDEGKTLFFGLHLDTTIDTTAAASRPERVAGAAREALDDPQALTAAKKEAALEDLAQAPAVLQPFLRRAIEDPGGFQRGLIEAMPRMLFALLPVFAAIAALFYRGRKYPEHLYFAIHLHAFIFLALAVSGLSRFTGSPLLTGLVGGVALASIPVYATVAFRRVYGGSRARTLLKEGAIAVIYGLTSLVAFVGVVYWVSVRAA
ncbi:MAG: hypothetical protein ACT4P7_22165, partial [Gemmatimonadaceae bacterium]